MILLWCVGLLFLWLVQCCVLVCGLNLVTFSDFLLFCVVFCGLMVGVCTGLVIVNVGLG